MLKAKDKDKQLSMKLDSELNRVTKSAKRARPITANTGLNNAATPEARAI